VWWLEREGGGVEDQRVRLVFTADTSGVREANTTLEHYLQVMEDVGDEEEKLGSKKKKLSGDTKTAAEALIHLNRAGQDAAQGGISSVANNMENVLDSLNRLRGLGAEKAFEAIKGVLMGPTGLIVALTILATAGSDILKWLKELFIYDDRPAFLSQLEELQRRIDRLKEEKLKIDVDGTSLEELEDRVKRISKAVDEANAALTGQTEQEQEVGKRVKKTLGTAEGREALNEAKERLQDKTARDPENQAREYQSQLDRIDTELSVTGGATPQYAALQNKRKEVLAARDRFLKAAAQARREAEEAFATNYTQAVNGTGDDQQNAIGALGGMLGNTGFGQTFAGQRGRMTPEAVDREAQVKEAAERDEKQRKENDREAKRTADEAAKRDAASTRAAEQENEAHWQEYQKKQQLAKQAETQRERQEREAEQERARTQREAEQAEAAQLRAQQEALAIGGEERRLGEDERDWVRERAQLQGAIQQMIAMGANAMQIQEELGDDYEALMRDMGDIRQRQQALQLRRQTARMHMQHSTPRN
jgi:hypothetical protein